jgi:high-affinity K+ transport system ATPase subunit B
VDLVKLGLPRIDLMMFGDKSEQVGVDNVAAAAEKEEKLDDATREGQSSRLLAESGF